MSAMLGGSTRLWLLAAASLVSVGQVRAQESLNVGSGQGAQIFFNDTLTRSFNFGVTSSGEGASMSLSQLNIVLKRENAVSADVVIKIYGGFGGTGPLLGTYNIAATNYNNQFTSYALNIASPLSLTTGGYSLVMSTADTNNYFFKAGQLNLTDTNGNAVTSGFWVPDSNTDGTATTTLTTASGVLADHSVAGVSSVSFGNFRVGSGPSQSVALTNSGFYTGAGASNMTEALVITGTSTTGSGTLSTGGLTSGNLASYLDQGATTNLTVGLTAATVGAKTGSVTLNLGSVKGGSNSTLTAAGSSTSVGNRVINLTGTAYRAAAANFSATSVALGNHRVTETNVTGTTTVTNNVANDGFSEKLKLAVSSTSGATAGSMPASIVAGSNSNITVGLATITAGANSGTVTLGLTSDGTGTSGLSDLSLGSQAVTVTATGYRAAAANFSATSVDLGKFHVGATNLTGSTTISNTATNDAYSEKLKLATTSTSGATAGSMPALIAAGSNANISVGIANVASAGANSGTVTLGLESDGTGTSGLSALSLGSQVINVSATGYTGQSTWNTDANGVWNSFDGWDLTGGKPGVDGNLSVADTATFGAAATSARTITLGAAIPTLRTLTFNNANAAYYIAAGGAGRIQLGTTDGNGALNVQAGNHTISAGLELAQSTTANIASGSKLLLSGALDGTGTLNKSGTGTLAVDGTGTLSGATTVSAGLLTVNGSIADSSVTVASGGSLGGSGTVGSTTIQSGGTLTPGNSPGDLDVTGNLVWSSGGNYNWQLLDAAGAIGSGWDVITVTGDLDLSGLTSSAQFNLNLWTLQSINPDVNGLALNFDNSQSYTWTIARVGGSIIGFDASLFNIRLAAANGTAGFANDLGGGTLVVVQSGQNVNLVFQPVPEPSTYGLMLGGAVLALAVIRRRRRA